MSIHSLLEDHLASNPHISKDKHCVYQGDFLSKSKSFPFRSKFLDTRLAAGENLLMHAGNNPKLPFPSLKSGIALTNYGLHFYTLRDSFFTTMMMYPWGAYGFVNFDDLKSLQFGDSDSCCGNQYEGHQLIVNDEVMGIVRMSNGLVYDEPAIVYCNQLFQRMVGEFLEKPPSSDDYPGTLM